VKRSAVFYWLIGIVIAAILITAAFYFDNAVRDLVGQHQNPTMRNLMCNVRRFGAWLVDFVFGRVLRCSYFRELANRAAVSRDSDFDRLLANLRRRTLFVGRDLRGRAWNPLRACRLANWQSKIESRKLSGRPNDGLALLNA